MSKLKTEKDKILSTVIVQKILLTLNATYDNLFQGHLNVYPEKYSGTKWNIFFPRRKINIIAETEMKWERKSNLQFSVNFLPIFEQEQYVWACIYQISRNPTQLSINLVQYYQYSKTIIFLYMYQLIHHEQKKHVKCFPGPRCRTVTTIIVWNYPTISAIVA